MDIHSYPDVLRRFRQRFNEKEVLATIMNQLREELDLLKSAHVCLSIGTGYGEFDIDFIKCCLPNLKKIIAVEKDHQCVEELRVNLKNAFGDELEVEIFEMTIEDFMRCEKTLETVKGKVDIVLAIHVLYFLSPDNRRNLLNMCFNNWMSSNNGMFFFVNGAKEISIVKFLEVLKPRVYGFQYCEQMKQEITSMGLHIIKEKPFKGEFDLKYDKDLYAMYKFNHLMPVTEEMILKALAAVAPRGIGTYACEVCVVTK